jgi:hypothetical protein
MRLKHTKRDTTVAADAYDNLRFFVECVAEVTEGLIVAEP